MKKRVNLGLERISGAMELIEKMKDLYRKIKEDMENNGGIFKKIKKGLKIACVTALIGGAFIGGAISGMEYGEKHPKSEVKIESIENKGDRVITTYTDDSFTCVNLRNNTYSFQPVEMGDWDYETDNINDFNKMLSTYLSIKNKGYY